MIDSGRPVDRQVKAQCLILTSHSHIEVFPHFKPGRLRRAAIRQTERVECRGSSRGTKCRTHGDFTLERATSYPQLAARPPGFQQDRQRNRDRSAQLHARDSLMRGRVLSGLGRQFHIKSRTKTALLFLRGWQVFFFCFLFFPSQSHHFQLALARN